MFQGGFQCLDMERLLKESTDDYFPLPCDASQAFSRQVLTNNGRTATVYLLENCFPPGKQGVLLLPDYLCLSVIVAIETAKIPYRFYHINRELGIDMRSLHAQLGPDVLALYIIDYFGAPYDKQTVQELLAIKTQWNIPIVEDLTQALLSTDPGGCMGFGDYLVASTRKWLPATDGGLVAARDGAPFRISALGDPYNEAAYKQLLISLLRNHYDNRQDLDARAYIRLEQQANKARYVDLSPREMTPYSRNILFASDIPAFVNARRVNYQRLYANLSAIPGIHILSKPLDTDGHVIPFGLTVLTEERDAFYEHMAKNGVIGEIQWILPTEYYTPGEDALYLSNHNVMFQCDQRYTEKDMDDIANKVESFFR